ncbi:hypothetical protein [Pseudoalteromonas ulvae]|uniref:Uncharacterized protein n=1 Tax=Pseudoalteromonas ulvae TaxID=107327 RepID=A0A244CQP6_PSEDV|nr:hypothetical protein [Pseudoalteromonas ulvae]OUL57898.1 hypothetical protein B1199_12670 [Pseudoalteromonas ulvae]
MIDINSVLIYIYNGHAVFVCLVFFAFIYIKDYKAATFSFCTAISFLIGIAAQGFLYENDNSFVYRYIFWASNDLIWMACIAYLAIKDKVYLLQSIIGQLVVALSPIIQIFRLLDRHLWDLSYSDLLYKSILPLINFAIVFICFIPFFTFFFNKSKSQKQLAK